MAEGISDDSDVVAWLKNEMRKGLQRELLMSCWGPAIYGPGNFEVYEDHTGEWLMRPIEGWEPAEPKGVVNGQNRAE